MLMHAPEQQLAAGPPPDGALLPRSVRRVALGIVGALLGFAVYLMIVRGPALFLDLAHITANMLCL